jgi:hypothetical protein
MEKENKEQLMDDFAGLDIDFEEIGMTDESGESQEQGVTDEDREILQQQEEPEDGSQEQPTKEDDESQGEEPGDESQEEELGDSSEEDEQPKEDTKDKEEGETSDGEESNPLQLHAAIMKERGLLPPSFNPDEVEGETLDEQIKSLADTIEKGYEDRYSNLKGSVDELSKEVIDKIEAGFSEEEAKQSVIEREKVSKITDEQLESDEKLAENVYRQYLEMSGVPDKAIDKMIKRSKDADTLYEDSKEGRDGLPDLFKEKDKQKEQQIQEQERKREKKREETLKTLDKQLNDLEGKEIYPGLKVSKKDIPKIKDLLLKPTTYEEDENGKQIPISKEQQLKKEDPVNYYIRWAALANAGAFDKDFDPTKVKKNLETDATKKLSKKIQEQQTREKNKKSGMGRKTPKKEEKGNDVELPDFSQFGL